MMARRMLHAAGKLVRAIIGEFFDPDEAEPFIRLLAGLGTADIVHAQAEHHILAHR
jgi:hypothetical protein